MSRQATTGHAPPETSTPLARATRGKVRDRLGLRLRSLLEAATQHPGGFILNQEDLSY